MYIHGVGIISPAGRGLAAQRDALTSGSVLMTGDGLHRVHDQDLKDPILVKEARRSDRFDRMAILAGLDALADAGIRSDAHASNVGLILATSLGPHVTTFRFLDDMINFKEKDVSPTIFSHSVHNAAASYLSLLAGIHGPTLTVARFAFAFHEALEIASAWLEQKRCEYVVVGAVDESGAVMEDILRSRSSAVSGRNTMRPGLSGNANIDLGEGGVFFVLSRARSKRKYGRIEPMHNAAAYKPEQDQLVFLETDGLVGDEDRYFDDRTGGSVASTSAWFGLQACLGALSCALAACLMDDPKLYPAIKPELFLKRSPSGPDSCISISRDHKGTTRAIKISSIQ